MKYCALSYVLFFVGFHSVLMGGEYYVALVALDNEKPYIVYYRLDSYGELKFDEYMNGLPELDKTEKKALRTMPARAIRWIRKVERKSGEITENKEIKIFPSIGVIGDKILTEEGWIYILELVLKHSNKVYEYEDGDVKFVDIIQDRPNGLR